MRAPDDGQTDLTREGLSMSDTVETRMRDEMAFNARATVVTGAERVKEWDTVPARIPHGAGDDANPHPLVPIIALDPTTDSAGQGERL